VTYGKATVLKTTVYFPDELKRRIEYTARIERKSKAEIIRAAVDEYTHTKPPRTKLPLFSSGKPIKDWGDAMRGFGKD
jgi:Ribbon-helix-helix protein, copG family